MFSHAARVSAREQIVSIAGQIADDDANGFALIEVRLGRRQFEIQRVQKFNEGEDQKPERLARLNR
jgi:hypothetical protein